jgi:histidine triad (HIT) family protein
MSDRDLSCLFCRIIAGEIPAQVLYQNEEAIVIADINPQAPIHVLAIPRQHISSIADINDNNATTLIGVINAANTFAYEKGLKASGYRLVINHGADAGQSVAHLHIHVLGEQAMGWPPFPQNG